MTIREVTRPKTGQETVGVVFCDGCDVALDWPTVDFSKWARVFRGWNARDPSLADLCADCWTRVLPLLKVAP